MAITLFETIELREGRPFVWDRHRARLVRSATTLGLGAPDAGLLDAAVARTSSAWGPRPGRLRVTWTADGPGRSAAAEVSATPAPRLTVHASAMVVRTDPTDVVLALGVHDERGPTSGHKTSHVDGQVAEYHRAVGLGAGEALLANRRGELCEGTTCNVVVVLDGVVCTPPLSSGCLPGVTRELLLETAAREGLELVERPVRIEALGRAEEVALVSTGRHLQPVRAIDGRPLPTVDGPSIRALRARFRAAHDTPSE